VTRRAPLVSRKRPKQARSVATVDAILTAAAQVLVAVGLERATTTAIAERAGVSVGSLYQYFPHKEALIAALIERHVAEMGAASEQMLAAAGDLPLPDAIRAMIGLLMELALGPQPLHAVLAGLLPRLGPLEQLDALETQMIERTRAWLVSRGLGERAQERATLAVLSMQSVLRAPGFHALAPPQREALGEELERMLLAMLSPAGAGQTS
jgi:AcrR family transcriptional regulator